MKVPHRLQTAKTARWAAVVVVGLIGLCVASEGAVGAAAGSTSPATQALRHSLSAAKGAGSVKITVQFFTGSTTGRVVQDSAANSGEQTVAIGKELASVVLVGGVAYISGNGQGMASYFGLPGSVASSLAGRWISLQPTDSAFKGVTANLTLNSALGNVTPKGTLTTGKRSTVNGQSVESIVGAPPGGGGRLTLFVSAHGRSLPVEAVESSGSGASAKGEIVTFTRWGEHLHLPTPSGAVPISTIEAASSAGN